MGRYDRAHFGEPMNVAFGALYLASDEGSKLYNRNRINIDEGILAGSDAKPE